MNLSTRMKRAPIFVEKKLEINKNRPVLKITENLKNEAREEFKIIWGQHPAFGYPFLDHNCVIDITEAKLAKTGSNKITENLVMPLDSSFRWPVIKSAEGKNIDLSRIILDNNTG